MRAGTVHHHIDHAGVVIDLTETRERATGSDSGCLVFRLNGANWRQ